MKSPLSRPGKIALLLLAIATPAFAGRMLDYSGPAEVSRAAELEPGDAPVMDILDDDGEVTDDLELMPESAEPSDDGLPVEAVPASPPSRWKWSRAVSLGVSADDNINLSSRRRESDVIFGINGHLQLLWGLKKEESFLKIDYAPSLIRFADHSQANAFDQKGSIAGQWRTAKLTLGAQIGAQSLSGGDVDVGERTSRNLWQIGLQAKYDLSTKTSVEVTLAPNASNYSRYLSSLEWVNGNWIDYQVFPKTRLGVGLTLGYLKAENSTAQTYQQALVRISNPVSGKVTVQANGGVEYRQLGGGGGTQTTPVFRLGASYQPTERLDITLEGSRRIYSSASRAAENFITTGGTLAIRQRLSQRSFVAVAGGYEDAQYSSTDGRGGAARHDQYFHLRPSISIAFNKWITLELYYQYRRNISTAVDSEFDSNIAGIQATTSF